MGYWKNKMNEWEYRGYRSTDTMVCRDCFGDYALKDFIKEIGQKDKCDYCGSTRLCAPLEDVIGKIVKGAMYEYEDANECMFYDSAEGGFHGATTYDSYDFVYEVLNMEMEVEDNDLIEDIFSTINDYTWCKKSPYTMQKHDEDYFDWKEFCERVMKLSSSANAIASDESEMLDKVCGYIEKLGLLVNHNKGNGFYRVRGHDLIEYYSCVKDIGSAPDKDASENRMSEKGHSMFYGADDIDTAKREIDSQNYECTTSAKFFPTKRLKVIDLTKLDKIRFPSLFDDDNRDKRSPMIFLRRFTSDVSKPINGTTNNEYRPTQVITAYLEKLYKFEGSKNIDGIIYKSSKNESGKCCALFFDNDKCTDRNDAKEKMLWMDKESLFRTDNAL